MYCGKITRAKWGPKSDGGLSQGFTDSQPCSTRHTVLVLTSRGSYSVDPQLFFSLGNSFLGYFVDSKSN